VNGWTSLVNPATEDCSGCVAVVETVWGGSVRRPLFQPARPASPLFSPCLAERPAPEQALHDRLLAPRCFPLPTAYWDHGRPSRLHLWTV
jgi:hypothetical protein